MCTAFGIFDKSFLFGRTLDLDRSFGENVTVTPRNFPLSFLYEKNIPSHYAIIGAAITEKGIPLYYDGVNEWGLCMAGLNFPESAKYNKARSGMKNIASFELIPYILSTCKSLEEAESKLKKINITSDSVTESLTATPLHWIIANKNGALTAEPVDGGLSVYKNPFCALANEPPFPYHLQNVRKYTKLTSDCPENTPAPDLALSPCSSGTETSELAGIFSSPSRFVKAVFIKSHYENAGENGVCSFFHIADSVSVPSGCVKNSEGRAVRTVYTCCMDTDSFTYNYTTYNRREILSVSASPYIDGYRLTELRMG